MKKVNLIFALLLSLMGVTQVFADNADFENALPDGWESVGTMTYYERPKTGSYSIGNGSYNGWDTNRGNYIKTTKLEGDITLWLRSFKANTTGYVSLYKLSEDGETVGDKLVSFSSSSTTFAEKSYTLSEPTRLAIVINYAHLDNMTYTEYVQADGPALAVTGYKDGSSYAFGMVEAGASTTFTLTNPGTAEVSASITTDGGFTADPASVTIAAGGSETLTITAPETSANGSVTITPDAAGLEAITIGLSCVIKDPNKLFIDFESNAMPDTWTMDSGWSVSSNGYATINYASYSGGYVGSYIRSSAITVDEGGENLSFDYKRNYTWSASDLKVYWATTGNGSDADWTECSLTPEFEFNVWKSATVTIPANAKYIAIYGVYVDVDNIYGLAESQEAVFDFTAEDYSFGMISAEASKDFTVKNVGAATLTGLTAEVTGNFVVDVAESIEAKGSTPLTVTMKTDSKGAQEGVVTLKVDGETKATFNVSGYVLDTDVIVVDFEGNAIPENWENSGYSISNNEISTTYNTRTLTSPAITVEEGQSLVIYAKGGSTYGAELTVKTSTDNGTTWTTAKEFTTELRNNTTDYVILTVDNIEAGNYKLQFEGYYVTINTINGYNYNQNAPQMAVTPVEDAAFGVVTAETSKTYTVANTGTGEMTVSIASDNDAFVVSPAELTVSDEAQTFTVTFTPTEGNYGKFEANITVTPDYDESAAVTLAASATVKNPNVWDEDFEGGSMPTGWDATNWTIGTFTSYENKTNMALAPSSSTAGTLITPPLEAKAGDVLTWEAYLNWYDEALIVEYSSDEKANWTELYNYKTQDDTEAPSTTERYYTKPMSFTAPADGIYYLRFTSTYQNGVDNFNGFKLALKEHDALITAQNIPASGNQYVEYTATVTVKELVGKTEKVNVEFYLGDDQVGETVEGTLAANGTETFAVTFTPTEAFEGEAGFTVTFVGEDDEVFATFESDLVAVNIAAAPVLDETVGALDALENWGNYPAIALNYSLKAGWNSIILPFEVSDLSIFGEGVKAYEFSDYTNGEIGFRQVTSLNAQTPYVLYAEEAATSIVFTDVKSVRTSTEADDLNVKKNSAVFQGTYAPVAAPDMAGKYGVVTSTGRIQKGSEKASMKGFRAYFELPAGSAAGVKANFTDLDGTVTAIEGVQMLNTETGDIFDLSGRKVAGKAKAGVYIQNGKKVVVK